jgi:hypothetical protein
MKFPQRPFAALFMHLYGGTVLAEPITDLLNRSVYICMFKVCFDLIRPDSGTYLGA